MVVWRIFQRDIKAWTWLIIIQKIFSFGQFFNSYFVNINVGKLLETIAFVRTRAKKKKKKKGINVSAFNVLFVTCAPSVMYGLSVPSICLLMNLNVKTKREQNPNFFIA